jgi:hypothetical protein
MNLSDFPSLSEVPEGLHDDEVSDYILDYFSDIHTHDPTRALDFTVCLTWILQIIIARGADKAYLLFRIGIILLNPFLLVNPTLMSRALGFFSPRAIEKRMKSWPTVTWSDEDTQTVLDLYETGLDPDLWAVKEPPTSCVFFNCDGFSAMEQIRQRGAPPDRT